MDVRDWDHEQLLLLKDDDDEKEKEEEGRVFCFMTKHFCGFATDLLLAKYVALSAVRPCKLCVAPCCHGLIVRETFFGDLEWIEKELGLDFELLKHVAGWATMNNLESDVVDEETQMTRRERQQMGLKAKLVFDTARLRRLGAGKLVKYTSESVECNLILLKQENKKS